MKIVIKFELSEAQEERLIHYAMRTGFLLEEPRRAITLRGQREAIEYAIRHAVAKIHGEKE
jgi:hypothetical protein